ncbi:DUF2087 domain-containing protein [Nocardioides zeae]|uniref:DUF2087 domain-containing protein n=1 Tax=Nocardioides imazamoxiresistens TaxID=3231893 RepID=A0ABU3PYH0_9ACTN|nr:DUF2087 domain-containing protein [Nocardioides zeae]MDT9593931.1 DUF2087 domain-containing protein [Nocardioides zeae]
MDPTDLPALPAAERARVLAQFVDADGALHTMPTKHTKRLVVLDHVAQVFEPGVVYPELEVNTALRRFHPDVAALRRYLVENGFLEREANRYWRSGGRVEV